MSILLVINSEKPPVKREFLHYTVEKNNIDSKITLVAWENLYYQHPDVDPSKAEVLISVTTPHDVISYRLGSYDAGVLETLEAAHRAVFNVHFNNKQKA